MGFDERRFYDERRHYDERPIQQKYEYVKSGRE